MIAAGGHRDPPLRCRMAPGMSVVGFRGRAQGPAPTVLVGSDGSIERLESGLGATQNQCVDVVGAFVGIDRFQIA